LSTVEKEETQDEEALNFPLEEKILIVPYRCFRDPYEDSGTNEDRDSLDDYHQVENDYWKFLGPPIYDTSRAGSVVYEPSVKLALSPPKVDITRSVQSWFPALGDSLNINPGHQMEFMITGRKYSDSPSSRGSFELLLRGASQPVVFSSLADTF